MASEIADDPRPGPAPPQPLGITIQAQSRSIVLLVVGEIDLASVTTLRTCLDQAITDSFDSVIVDLGGVTFLDSTGIAALLHARNQLQAAARDLSIRHATGMVRRVLSITGLDELLIDPGLGPDSPRGPG